MTARFRPHPQPGSAHRIARAPTTGGDNARGRPTLAEQRAETITLESDVSTEDDGCAHHWQIATPNGVTSEGVCKRCGKSRAFLNYSQRKMMVRSVKSNGNGNKPR